LQHSNASIFRQKAEMFERRAEQAIDPISKQHYREMAAHYRQLLVEHLDYQEAAANDEYAGAWPI
jgi:hypothetical protein